MATGITLVYNVAIALKTYIITFATRLKTALATLEAHLSTSAVQTTQDSEVSEPKPSTDSDKWNVVRLANGLISLENTPPWLVDVVYRNAMQSPLLRLPAEIRSMIWQYATNGDLAHVRIWWAQSTCTGHGLATCYASLTGLPRAAQFQDRPLLLAAINLPRVCRQIYFETSTLAYSGTIFFFDTHHPQDVKSWAAHLTPAHKNAITDIAGCGAWLTYPVVHPGQPLRATFPGLQRVHIYGSGYPGYKYAKEGDSWRLLEGSDTHHDKMTLEEL